MGSVTFAAKIRSGIAQSASPPYPPVGVARRRSPWGDQGSPSLPTGAGRALGAIWGHLDRHPAQVLGFHGPTSGNRANGRPSRPAAGSLGTPAGLPWGAMGSGTGPLCPAFFDPGALEACGAPGATSSILRLPWGILRARSLWCATGGPGARSGTWGTWGHPSALRAPWGILRAPWGCLGTGLVGRGGAGAWGGPADQLRGTWGDRGRPALRFFFSCLKPAEICRFLPQ